MENKDKSKAGKKADEDWLGGMQTYNVDWKDKSTLKSKIAYNVYEI